MEDQTAYGNRRTLHKEFNFPDGIRLVIDQESNIQNVEALEKALSPSEKNIPSTLKEFLLMLHSSL